MVTIGIVINSTRVMGIRVTICCRYCIAFEVMLLFSSFLCVDYYVLQAVIGCSRMLRVLA